jgi:hypothetical protein
LDSRSKEHCNIARQLIKVTAIKATTAPNVDRSAQDPRNAVNRTAWRRERNGNI